MVNSRIALWRVMNLLVVGVVFWSFFELPVLAQVSTTCPKLTETSSDWEKMATYLAGSTKPKSPAEFQRAMTMAGIEPLIVGPPAGAAPLEVTVRWWWYPVENVLRVDFDVDGDGQAEWSQPDFDSARDPLIKGTFQDRYTYKEPGHYEFTVHIEGSDGQDVTYSAPIKVISLKDLDLELQSRWTAMKSALRRGNVEEALECILSEKRDGYRRTFNDLIDKVDLKNIDSILTDITFVETIGASAEYQMLRKDKEGLELSYLVQFNLDLDGIWRITFF